MSENNSIERERQLQAREEAAWRLVERKEQELRRWRLACWGLVLLLILATFLMMGMRVHGWLGGVK